MREFLNSNIIDDDNMRKAMEEFGEFGNKAMERFGRAAREKAGDVIVSASKFVKANEKEKRP